MLEPKRLLEFLFLVLLVSADQCTKGEDFKAKEGRTSCTCDRSDADFAQHQFSELDIAPSCLLNTDENQVAPFFLEPHHEKPEPLEKMEEWEFWQMQTYFIDCPQGFKDGVVWDGLRNDKVTPGKYRFQAPDWLPYPYKRYADMKCNQVRPCPSGFFCTASGRKLACGKGELCNETGLERPRPCPAGYYCPTSLFAMECFRGSYCPRGSLVPRICRKGNYCPTPCDEIICPAGHWCPEASYQSRPCNWWNHCPQGSSSVDWYRLGIVMALSTPVIFEFTLRFLFKRPVHMQKSFRNLQGMTVPCLVLLCITMVVGWILMPYVALAKTTLLLYTVASVAMPHRIRKLRFGLVFVGAMLLSFVQGVLAAVWLVYVPVCLFAGFLFAAPNAEYQRRGFKALICLSAAFALGDIFLFLAGGDVNDENKTEVTVVQGILAAGHLWMFLLAVMGLFFTEVDRQQRLQAAEAFLVEMEETNPASPSPSSRPSTTSAATQGATNQGDGEGGWWRNLATRARQTLVGDGPILESTTETPTNRSKRGKKGPAVGISFQLQDVGLTVRGSKKMVLKDISMEIAPDSSCALMGPSGSGKSSLLNVLTGRALQYGEVDGTIMANKEPIPEGLESNLKTKNAAGFVPQDDVMHTDLTVYENVYFSARLRLAPNTGLFETASRVEKVLKDVGISHVKDTVVGNAEIRGISGGQRKRCSIAMELVGEPAVLFLDEPTSGLDAAAAHSIVSLLCNKDSLNCTMVAVIHQPRWQTLECFDQVVLLATGGFLVYSGSVAYSVQYFKTVLKAEIPDKANPADCFLDFIDNSNNDPSESSNTKTTVEELAAQWRTAGRRSVIAIATEEGTFTEDDKSFQSAQNLSLPPLSAYEKFRPGVSETFWTLYLRCCIQVCRMWKQRVSNLCLLAAFLMLVRIMLGDDGDFEKILTKMTIAHSMLMLPMCIHSMYVFTCDRLERQREDTAGIPQLSQYLAKDFCHFVEVLIFATLWTGIYGPFSRVAANPIVLLRLSVAQCYLAFGISFWLSVNLPNQSTATVTIMLLLVVAQLCSGVDMIAYGEVHGALGGLGWLFFTISPSLYTVERILPILLFEGSEEPVRRAVCNGYLMQKGVRCEEPPSHTRDEGIFSRLMGEPTYLGDLKQSYIFLSSDVQLVMFAVALRVITLFQLLIRTGSQSGNLYHRIVGRLVLPLVAIFLLLTVPLTANNPANGKLI